MSEFSEFNPQQITEGKCKDCGVQCSLETKYIKLAQNKAALTEAGEILVTGIAVFDDTALKSLEEAGTTPEEYLASRRKKTAEELDSLDEDLTQTANEMTANELACNGVLRMRASRDGITYTANVCTSARKYTLNGEVPNHIPTHISATTQNN